MGPDVAAADVLGLHREEIARANTIIAAVPLDTLARRHDARSDAWGWPVPGETVHLRWIVLHDPARALDDAVPGLEGLVAADALIGAFARQYRCDGPGDAELIDRIGRELSAKPLETLVTAKAVPARDVLRAGLTIPVRAGRARQE